MNETKVLIIGPSWVGDMVMAQVLFKLLKQSNPQLQIDVLAPNWSLPVLQRMPEINQAIPLPIQHGEFGLLKRIKIGRELRSQNYQQAIVLANSWKSALIPWVAKIPLRTGWLGEMRWGLLNDVRYLNKKKLPKMVQRYAALGLPSGAVIPEELPVPKLDAPAVSVTSVLHKFAIDSAQPILALCPGAAYGSAKRWPEEYFAKIAQQRINAGWQVWLFGSQQDNIVIEKIRSQVNGETRSFAGKIDLMETIDLLSTVNAVVTNDSGLLHIAASLNKPLVAIYGSTSAQFTPPLGKKSKIVQEQLSCRPCFKRECPLRHLNCMYLIKPERVLAAIDELEEA
ncbi:MAG TPA: lipopolysaccharide heptosyltransferase II [Gammaproteobacteria bacterium]|nr:lipopolysaccharide heptosyltransferase II [Gammaproteobacteria bacterium]